MPLALATILLLAQQCAPSVAPTTLASLARVESGFEPLAVGVNGPRPYRLTPGSLEAATAKAEQLIADGANIDLGLAQVNSANLRRLGLSVRAAFDPCRNLEAAGEILSTAFRAELRAATDAQSALRFALSRYNTGDPVRGFRNGYLAKVNAAARLVDQQTPAPRAPPEIAEPRAAVPVEPPPWAVFGVRPGSSSFILKPTAQGDAP